MNYDKYSIVADDSGPSFVMYEDDEKDEFILSDYNEEENQIEFDKYISSTVRHMEDNMEQVGITKGRKRGPDGKFIGKYNENPILDTSVYEIEFQDGRVESYFANQIVECILDESEAEANITHHIKDFVDHRRDSKALTSDEAFLRVKGKTIPRRTTKGWHICAELSDGKTEWLNLKTAKDTSPIKAAKYAVANKISNEPAFRWWVPYVLRKYERIIKAVKRRSIKKRKTEKFGLEIPRPNDVQRA